jgi:polysaccharide export outer membrane protein
MWSFANIINGGVLPMQAKDWFSQLRSWRALIVAVLILCCYAGGSRVSAQQSIGQAPMVKVADRPASTDDTRYRIGAGDVLTVVVRKAAELSGTVRVDQRGMIRLPMIDGEIFAACKTETELASIITNHYLEYKKSPNVDVFVTEFQSRPVAVIGAVGSPGQFRLQRQVRLLELLSLAGGPAPRAGRTVNIIHAGGVNICQMEDPNRTAGTEPGQELVTYLLNDTLKGVEGANPFVRPGDIISLPEADQVFIIGHVMSPQAISLRDKPITISRAIAMSGGPARDAKTSKIRITRQDGDGGAKTQFLVDLSAVLKQKAIDIPLMANDIVEVPSSTGKTILNTLQGAIAPALSQVPVRAIP